jgi:hypothetical protein
LFSALQLLLISMSLNARLLVASRTHLSQRFAGASSRSSFKSVGVREYSNHSKYLSPKSSNTLFLRTFSSRKDTDFESTRFGSNSLLLSLASLTVCTLLHVMYLMGIRDLVSHGIYSQMMIEVLCQ